MGNGLLALPGQTLSVGYGALLSPGLGTTGLLEIDGSLSLSGRLLAEIEQRRGRRVVRSVNRRREVFAYPRCVVDARVSCASSGHVVRDRYRLMATEQAHVPAHASDWAAPTATRTPGCLPRSGCRGRAAS